MSFEDSLKKVEALLSGASISVLVWGSGTGSPKDYEKRGKIRKVLSDYFRNADVKFSEDPSLRALVPGAGEITIPQEELWQLAACDVCVALDTSAGVSQEIARFTGTRFTYKLLILTNEQYKGSTGFPALLRENQNQVFYSDLEYDSCSLCGRVLQHVKTVVLNKFANNGIA
jgi:hypothetical protein